MTPDVLSSTGDPTPARQGATGQGAPQAHAGGWRVALLGVTFFLLSADLLNVAVAGAKIKYGYFALLALWLTAPGAMVPVAVSAVRRVPAFAWLPLAPMAVAVATSVNVAHSIAWGLWLAFDLLAIVTIYAYLKAHAFSGDDVRRALTLSLLLVAAGGAFQFAAIYLFDRPVLSPQLHFDIYRLNGVSGWPHFLNIFAFLMLPIVIVQRRMSWPTRGILVVLMFVLVQSTAKSGWVLFVALGALLLLLDRPTFRRAYLGFLLPVIVVLLVVPTPSANRVAAAPSGGEKISRFSADLDVGNKTTSGNDRLLINRMGLAVWWRHPWFGVGPRAFDDYVWTRFDSELPGVNKLDANGNVNAKNENIWIEFLAECGALFTAALVFVVVRVLWVRRFEFRNHLHLGAWIALVLYFSISGQVSQSGLLTMVYAIAGCYFYARELGSPLGATTRLRTLLPARA
jgi:hypothetical protein